jgi:hypothetical protein
VRTIAASAPLIAVALAPPVALAHGISGEATNKTTIEYIPLGIEHMLLGWDHLLFVLGIVLLAGSPKRAAKLISLFVAGHSLTLIVATIAEWRVSPAVVDGVIALSVVFVAALGLRGRPRDWSWTGLAIFVFGLIHGLGLSTRLQDLGIPDAGLLGKTVAFNIGIEIGQLLAVALMVGIVWLLGTRVPRWSAVRTGTYAAMGVAGAVAAVLLFAGVGDDETAIAGATASCSEKPSLTRGGANGKHPDKDFYGPNEQASDEDLGHVRGDGFVVVRYRPNLPPAQVEELRQWVQSSDKALVAAPDPKLKEPIVAKTSLRIATCTTYDFAAVKKFADKWFAEVVART